MTLDIFSILRVGIGALAISSAPVIAQTSDLSVGQSFAHAYPVTLEGSFAGCAINFGKIALDTHGPVGKPLYVTGNLSFYKKGLVSLSVITAELRADGAAGPIVTPKVPAAAYLFSAKDTLTKADRMSEAPSATPGGLFQIFNMTPAVSRILLDVIERQEIQIALNYGSISDVIVKIDLLRASKELGQTFDGRPNDVALQFAECTQRVGK